MPRRTTPSMALDAARRAAGSVARAAQDAGSVLTERWVIDLRAADPRAGDLRAADPRAGDLHDPVSGDGPAPSSLDASATVTRRGRHRQLVWHPGDPDDPPFPSLAGDVPLVIRAPDVATLEAFARHASGRDEIRYLTVAIAHWEPPQVGWSGRPPLPPGVVRWDLRLPDARGPVRVEVGLRRPRPLRAILAAVLGTLEPVSDLPTAASPSLAAFGVVPAWLGPSREMGVRVPGLGLGSGRHIPRLPPGQPEPRLPLVDLELVRVGHEPEGLGRMPFAAATASDHTLALDDEPRLLLDPRAVPPARWSAPADMAQPAEVHVASVDGRVAWRGVAGDLAASPWRPVAAPIDASTLAWLRDQRSITPVIETDTPPDAAAALVARVCLTGAVVTGVSLPGPVGAFLSDELRALVGEPLPDESDALAWEARSVRQRRAVLRAHAPQLATTLGALPPSVSVLLMTRRAGSLGPIRAMLARQTYPTFEVLLGVHTDDASLPTWDDPADVPMEAIRVPATLPLGEGYGRLMARARGVLVTKMDDDDIYGPEHLWDLVIARLLSGATVVGKAAEFVALDALGLTVRRTDFASDDYGRTVAGGTILAARGDLERLGGWRPVRSGVDRALLDRVLESCGLIYRTWALGFIYRRHDSDHTWAADASYFLRSAHVRWTGLPAHPEFGADLASPMADPPGPLDADLVADLPDAASSEARGTPSTAED